MHEHDLLVIPISREEETENRRTVLFKVSLREKRGYEASRLGKNPVCSRLCDSFVKRHSMNGEIDLAGRNLTDRFNYTIDGVARVYVDTATNFAREANCRGVASRRTN